MLLFAYKTFNDLYTVCLFRMLEDVKGLALPRSVGFTNCPIHQSNMAVENSPFVDEFIPVVPHKAVAEVSEIGNL